MNLRFVTMSLATLFGAASLMPSASAANVGTYGSCFGGSKNTAITNAGHTPVTVAALDAASLNGLGALIIENCNGSPLSSRITADVTTAVSNGMLLVVDDWNPGAATSAALPGAPALVWQAASGSAIDLVSGMPYTTGAGGTLTNTSLDGGNSSNHGYTASVMPAGVAALLTTATPDQTVAITYAYGSGRVVYSAMPLDAYLPGGSLANSYPLSPGVQTYMTNILSNSGLVTVNCASEGYTGTKLTWCKNICEMGYTGATLKMWIRRWVDRYHDEPYCMAEETPVL